MWRTRHLAWQRNRWLIVGLGVFTACILVLRGSQKVVPYTVSPSLAANTRIDGAVKARVRAPGHNVQNVVDAFDVGIVHKVRITMDPAEYDAMITAYQRDGVKGW